MSSTQSFSQAQIAKKYNLSRATISRWVELAQQGKNNLQLDFSNKKVRILDNPHNEVELQRLSEEAKKYKNSIPVKNTIASGEFYRLFSEEETVEIFNDLKYKSQIKHKYVYKQCQFWDNFDRLHKSPVSKANLEMLEVIIYDIEYLVAKNCKINLIDIGPGNANPAKNLLSKLIKNKSLNSYITIDISQDMLDLATKNISEWFKNISQKCYEKDMETSRFGKIFLDNKTVIGEQNGNKEAMNLIVYLNSLCNLDDRIQGLKNIRSGMTEGDLLVVSFTLDNMANKAQLNYIKDSESTLRDGWHLQMLGIDIFDCVTTVEYDAVHNRKDKLYHLNQDYNISLKVSDQTKQIELHAGQKISTWRHYLLSIEKFLQELEQAELEMVNFKTDKTSCYAMALCKVKFED